MFTCPPEMDAARTTGLIEMSKGTLQSLTSQSQQPLAARATNASTIAVNGFALLPVDVEKLRNAENDEQLRAVIQDDIEERWDEPWLFQIDKGWAGIHRCLTDGRLACDTGEYPLRAAVLADEQLYEGDDFVVSLLTPSWFTVSRPRSRRLTSRRCAADRRRSIRTITERS